MISSNAKTATASPSAGAAILMLTVWMAATKRSATVGVRKTRSQAGVVLEMRLHLACNVSFIHSSLILSQHLGPVGRHCPLDEFQCNNTLCKPLGWKCDGEDDCGDNSDENPEECGENLCFSASARTVSVNNICLNTVFSLP